MSQMELVSIRSYLSLNFIIEELLFKLCKSIVGTVVVQIKGVQHIPGGERVMVAVLPTC